MVVFTIIVQRDGHFRGVRNIGSAGSDAGSGSLPLGLAHPISSMIWSNPEEVWTRSPNDLNIRLASRPSRPSKKPPRPCLFGGGMSSAGKPDRADDGGRRYPVSSGIPKRQARFWPLLLLTALVPLTACSPIVDGDQTVVAPEMAVRLEPGHPVGQTFVARHGGLSGVEFWLEPEPGTASRLLLHLRSEPHAADDLAVAVLPLDGMTTPGFYRFSFPPDNRSYGVYRYAFLELEGTGAVRMGTGPGEAYLDGAAYRDHEPLDAQLAFRLVYDPWGILVDISLMVAGWIKYGAFGVTVLFLAGYWIVRGWAHRSGSDFTVILITSIVSALAIWMLLLVWSDFFKIRLSEWIVRLLLGASVLVGTVFFIRDRWQWGRQYWLGKHPTATLVMWLVIVCSIGLRLWIGRALVMLPGSDAYHHTLIVQLFADQGGIPAHYEPYAPLQSFSYHFGFHSIVALFRWLLGSELLSATKVVALVLNGGIAATAGLLGEQLAGHRRAGIVAAALVGLIMVSPFCLLRWSRFTQTTGLFFLPIALLALVWEKRKSGLLFPSLLVTTVFFAHTRVALMLGIFAAIAAGVAILQRRKEHFMQVIAVGAISILLVAPWLLRVLWVQLDPYGLRITYPILGGYNDINRIEEPVLNFITNWPVVISVLLLATIACMSPAKKKSIELIIWCGMLVGGALLSAKIGFSLWDLKTTLLSLAIPVAGLAGLGIEALNNILNGLGRILARWVLVASLAIGAISASLAFPKLVYTGNIYLRPGDLIVMNWIDSNVPVNALFIADALQFDWSPGWIVGRNAGYWIPLLAHRDSVLPPMIYTLEWSTPILSQRLHLLLTGESSGDKTSLYLFSINDSPLMSSWLLNAGRSLEKIYQQDRVQIFEVIR